MQRHIEHAAILAHKHAGRALYGFRDIAALVHEAQPAGALGEDHAAIGQEGHAPGLIQVFHQGFDLEAGFLAVEEFAGDIKKKVDEMFKK